MDYYNNVDFDRFWENHSSYLGDTMDERSGVGLELTCLELGARGGVDSDLAHRNLRGRLAFSWAL